MLKKLILSGLTSILFSSVFSQTDFSGSWSFKDQQSVSGNLYANGSPNKIQITHMKTNISIQKVTAKGDGTDIMTSDANIGFDRIAVEGKTSSNRINFLIVEWSADYKSFMETTNIYSLTDAGKVDFKVTDTYSLSDDGKTLNLDRKDENNTNGEIWESIATYEK